MVKVQETGWLAELQGEAVPQWAVLTEDYDEHWTADAGKALRFARREDAEAFIAHHAWTRVVATEHMWPAARIRSALLTDGMQAE